MKYFAVVGKTLGGKSFRGIVTARGTPPIVEHGPAVLSGKPWHKRALSIKELKKFARVLPCPRPRLSASIQNQMEHKFAGTVENKELVARGRFLQFVQEVVRKLRDA